MGERLREAVYGLAIGDAVGVPYEFKQRGSFRCAGMIGYGTHHQPAGTWSDDTSMTLATCASIKNMGKIDCVRLEQAFNPLETVPFRAVSLWMKWYFHQAFFSSEPAHLQNVH